MCVPQNLFKTNIGNPVIKTLNLNRNANPSPLTGWVINVENINVEIQSGYLCRQKQTGGINVDTKLETYVDTFQPGVLMSKAKLETYVDTFELGALMSKHKLAIYVDTLVINVKISLAYVNIHWAGSLMSTQN